MRSTAGSSLDLNTVLRSSFALIMAGGRGSRLKQLTDNQAKPAIPFGGKFRIIDFPLSNCLNSGIRRIAVLTQYKAQSLIGHVHNGWGFLRGELNEFVELWPAQQQTPSQTWYLGTADSVYQNLPAIRQQDPTYILILAGDHVYRQDYSRMLAQHVESEADVSVACVDVPVEAASAFGVVGVDEADEIVSFVEKPAEPPTIPGQPDRAFASMGIYVFTAERMFAELEANAGKPNTSHDFGKDIIPDMVERNDCRVMCHRFSDSAIITEAESEAYWRDVGTVDAYWEANLDLTSVTPSLDLYDTGWPIWTYQVQRPPAKFVFDDDSRRGMAVDSLVSAGCIISGATVRRSLLSTGAVCHSHSLVQDSVILPNVEVGRAAVLKRCVVDQNCMIPPGLVVGEDADADATRFSRTDRGVTLITAEMLRRLER